MGKRKNNAKSNKIGNKKETLRKVAKDLVERGEVFGDALIRMLMQAGSDWEGIVVATIGMAKAMATLKSASLLYDQDFSKLYEAEYAFYERACTGVIENLKAENA